MRRGDKLHGQHIKCGSDKLFGYLRAQNLLIKLRRSYIKPTRSRHWLCRYPNLLMNIVVSRPEQVLGV